MTAILISDAEWDLLAGEPAELLKLYVALKRRMDFATGIAGHKTLLNEIVLREGFTVDPIPGRAKQKPVTREQYRSAVRRLEKLGLLVALGNLVFEFPHARRDSPPKRATTELQPEQQPAQQPTCETFKASNAGASTDLDKEQQPEQDTGVGPSSNLLPDSGIPPTALSAREAVDGIARQRFAMHDDWQPSGRGWKATAMRNGLGNTPVSPDALMEFRSFWINRPDKHQTQGQWEHDLAQSMKRGYRHAQSGNGQSTANAGQGSGSIGSLIDELTDTTWADRLHIPDD